MLKNGTWLNFNYDQIEDRYGYSISRDKGKTFERRYGAKKLATPFDEGMAYQRKDGSIRMLARCSLGELAELHVPPISKSGLNHRLQKLIDLAAELPD